MATVRRLSSRTIDDFTKLGYNELQSGHLDTAVEAFKNAHRHSIYLNDENTEQLCAFNLGAAYVAAKRPREGLELLSTAVPPSKQPIEKPKGDIYYNFGLGYETMENLDETIRYFELALEEYEMEIKESNAREILVKIATVCWKLACCYCKVGSHSQAAEKLKTVARLYEELEKDLVERIPVLCELGFHLSMMEKRGEALQYTDECFTYCGELKDSLHKGEMYHDLGLIYIQCQEFNKGCNCFELALPMMRQTSPGGKKETAVIQNLGACYNALGDYQRAVGFHEEALEKYCELVDQSGQAQCFNNLAFALINLGDFNGAERAHTQALNASADVGDTHNQWQSLEGLGTVAFNKGNVEEAIGHFRESVSILSATEENYPAHHRLLSKFRDSVNYKDLYSVRDVPPPPVINASMSINFCETFQRTGNYFNEEKAKDQKMIQAMEVSQTQSSFLNSLPEHECESDSALSSASSDVFNSQEKFYHSGAMLQRYRQHQWKKSASLPNLPSGRNSLEGVHDMSSGSRMKNLTSSTTRKAYVSKSRKARQRLSAELGLPVSSSECGETPDNKDGNDVEPEHADKLSQSFREGLVTLDINEKQAKMGFKPSRLKPVPKKAKLEPIKSKTLLKKEDQLKQHDANEKFLHAFNEIEIEKSGKKTGRKKKVPKKKKKVSDRRSLPKPDTARDSGVIMDTEASVEGEIRPQVSAAVQSGMDLSVLDSGAVTSSQVDGSTAQESELVASAAQGIETAPSHEAVESGTISGSRSLPRDDKKAKKRSRRKDICGTSTEVIEPEKNPTGEMEMEAPDGNDESDQSTPRFVEKAVQTQRRKSIVCSIM